MEHLYCGLFLMWMGGFLMGFGLSGYIMSIAVYLASDKSKKN